MMRESLKKLLVDEITEHTGWQLDRAYEEGQLDAYLEFIKPHHDGTLGTGPSALTKAWQTGFRAGNNQAFIDGVTPPSRYIDGALVNEDEWQRHQEERSH